MIKRGASKRQPLPRLVVTIVAMLNLVGCAANSVGSRAAPVGDGPPSPSAAPTASMPAATDSPTPDPNVVEGAIEVADGRSLYLACRGHGSPTVIFEAGDESGREDWSRIEPAISDVTRTCAYDRGGVGRSDPVTGCRQLSDLTGDLENLLDVAGVPGPYVLVAASGGGYIAAEFAKQHRDDIAGMVFAEVPKAFLDAPPEVVEATSCDNPTNVERRDYLRVEADAWNGRSEIGDIPVTIISNEYGPAAEPLGAANVVDQQGWLVLSPRATQVIIESGHDVTTNEPAVVIDAIIEVIEAARGR